MQIKAFVNNFGWAPLGDRDGCWCWVWDCACVCVCDCNCDCDCDCVCDRDCVFDCIWSDTGAATSLLSEPVLLATETDARKSEAAHPIDDYCQDPQWKDGHFSKLWLDSYLTYSSSFTPVLKGFLLLGRLSNNRKWKIPLSMLQKNRNTSQSRIVAS